jgi:hypothetical protein
VRFKIEVALASKALTIIIGGGGAAMLAASKQSIALDMNLFALAISQAKFSFRHRGHRTGVHTGANFTLEV